MPADLQTEGNWPGTVELRRGWGRASARPWNPLTAAGAIRLIRGNSGFLSDVATWTDQTSGGVSLSPALYPSGTRIWEKAGFDELLRLDVMEKAIDRAPRPQDGILDAPSPDLDELEALDRTAFDHFWHMGALGLAEALAATPVATTLEARDGDRLVGYAVVGAQLGISFLQRIAVAPDQAGSGLGTALVRAANDWADRRGASVMVLNVRPDNEPARALYAKTGFSSGGKQLLVMRRDSRSNQG